MRPFLLLFSLPGKASNFAGALGRLRALLPAGDTELLMPFESGAALGFHAEAPPKDGAIAEALGERAQFFLVELEPGAAWATDSFGVAANWLKRHLAPPVVR